MATPTAPPPPRSDHPFARQFVDSVLLTWIGNGARIVIGLVALRLVTGSIPDTALGAYWILTTCAALLANFADLGLGVAVVRHLPLASDRAGRRQLMQTVVLLRFGLLVVLCGLIWACRPWVLRIFDAGDIADRYFYLYPFVILTSLGELYNNFLQGQSRFRAAAIVALVTSLSRLVWIVVLVRGLALGITGLFVAEAASLALAVVVSALVSGHGWRIRADRALGERQVRFGFPLYLNTLLAYTSNRINTVMIGSMSTIQAVSWFSVAQRVPDQLSFMQRSFVFVYLPQMSRLSVEPDTQRARALLAASLRLMSFCFAMLALGLSYFRHELIAFLAPPAVYQAAAPAVPLLMGGLVFASLGLIMGNTFVAIGDSRTPVLINIWTSLLNLALNWFCIERWGFMGAAWANFLFNVAGYATVDAVLSRRIRPAGRSYLFLLGFLGAVLLAGLNATVAVRILLLPAAAGGSLALSPALRSDVIRVWRTRFANRLGWRNTGGT